MTKYLFRVSTFAKPSCNNVLQPSLLRGSGCNTLSHSGLTNVETRKRMFYRLIKDIFISCVWQNIIPLRFGLTTCDQGLTKPQRIVYLHVHILISVMVNNKPLG